MRSHGGRSHEVETKPAGRLTGFHVEVVDDLHVIGDESDRYDDHVVGPKAAQLAEVLADVGAEPGHVRRPAPALVDDAVLRDPDSLGDQAGRLCKLRLVPRTAGHRNRDRMGGERQMRALAEAGRDLGK
jgi:hypothetical protein